MLVLVLMLEQLLMLDELQLFVAPLVPSIRCLLIFAFFALISRD